MHARRRPCSHRRSTAPSKRCLHVVSLATQAQSACAFSPKRASVECASNERAKWFVLFGKRGECVLAAACLRRPSEKGFCLMRYHVLYLAAGDRQATHVEAPDAAAAVALVDAMQRQRAGAFELLCVVPATDDSPAEAGRAGAD